MNNEKGKIIEEYILESKESLILAAEIVDAFDHVIENLVQRFFADLESKLQEVLGEDWIIENGFKKEVFGKTPFCITKKSWGQIYSIGLYPERLRLRQFSFYIWRDKEVIPSTNLHITQLMNEHYKKGNAYKNGDWWQWVDGDYSNWTDNKVLVKLYGNDEMVEYFSNQFIQIKNIVEKAIDKEVEKIIK